MKRNAAIWGIVLVLVGVLAAGGTYLVLRDSPSETVLLEPADDDGPDPFTESVSLVEYEGLPTAAAPALGATIDSLPIDGSTGMRVASGDTAGLFGGSRSDAVCDVATLDAFLSAEENSAKAAAFAEASDIDTADLSSYLRSLTPVLLGGDTLVTNHGFSNGKLTSRQSVLQAGTAVLVDDRGVPRVRCSCGNPLAEPATSDLTNVSSPGAPWEGFDTERVVVPAPAPAVLGTFVLVDVADGSTYEQAPGEAAAMWIVVGGDDSGGQVQVSSDAEQWTTTLETAVELRGVAHGDGRSVVVGGTDGYDDQRGIIVATDNAETWSEPVETAVGLVDVAHGAGTWVALSQQHVYTSDDGANWSEQAPLPFEFPGTFADGVAFGDGQFVVTSHSCGASRCFPADTLRSGDGVTWTADVVDQSDSSLINAAIGYSDGFALVGYEWLELAAGQSNADQGAEPAAATMTGTSLTALPQAPGSPYLHSLSAAAGAWYGVGSTATATGDPTIPRHIYTSSDLTSWSQVGSLSGLLNDVILVGGAPRPVAAPEPAAADASGNVVMRSAALELLDEKGAVSDTIAYDSPVPAAIAALSRVLGEPSETESIEGDGTCVADSTSTSWGSFTLVHDGSDAAAAPGFTVYLGDGAPGPISTVGGIAPGTPASGAAAEAAAGMTRSLSHDGVQWQWFLLDVPAGDTAETTGVLATAQDGTITGLAAPEYLEDQC